MAELLHCPFCGSEGELVHPQDDMYIVGCSNEDCPMWCGLAFNMEEHAVKFWNTRTPKERGGSGMTDNKLKPCPFCGGKAHLDKDDIFCYCGLIIEIPLDCPTYEEARQKMIDTWNSLTPKERGGFIKKKKGGEG